MSYGFVIMQLATLRTCQESASLLTCANNCAKN